MDTRFINELMEKTGFPAEAKEEVRRCGDQLAARGLEGEFEALLERYHSAGFRAEQVQPEVDRLAEQAGFSGHTLWLLVLIQWAKRVKPEYEKKGVSGETFWATFSDLKYKVLECHEIHGVWGNFVPFWYNIFFTCDIVKLGRLEFESCTYPLDEPYTWGDITVKKGDPVKSIHIPSSGEPFDWDARLDAYRRAYAFFGEKPLICVCDSWLLYPPYRGLLPETSNVRSFMKDFHVIHQRDEEVFDDAWRVFGREYQKAPAALPEKTGMQRAFKNHLINGGSAGEGFGVLIFDGEKIINR